MGWLITLGILALLSAIPLGIGIQYHEAGFRAALVIGPVRFTVYPLGRRKKKEKAEPEREQTAQSPKKEKDSQSEKKAAAGKNREKGGSLLDFLPLVKLGLRFLGDLRRKIRVSKLEGKLILAGDDPCDLAVNYGRACAAMANLIVQLERVFVIKNRDLEVMCDFTASETLVIFHMEVTITLGRLLALAAVYGFRGIKEYFAIQKKRKGGAVT